jgi:hypothetical protein
MANCSRPEVAGVAITEENVERVQINFRIKFGASRLTHSLDLEPSSNLQLLQNSDRK